MINIAPTEPSHSLSTALGAGTFMHPVSFMAERLAYSPSNIFRAYEICGSKSIEIMKSIQKIQDKLTLVEK